MQSPTTGHEIFGALGRDASDVGVTRALHEARVAKPKPGVGV